MNTTVRKYIKQLGLVSQALSVRSIVSEHPWAFVKDSNKVNTLTFLQKGELLVQNSEGYSLGGWSFAGMFTLKIDSDGNEIIYRIEFLNSDLLILQLESVLNCIHPTLVPDDLVFLVNESIIDTNDIIGYLEKLRKQALNLVSIQLVDNRILEIQRGKDSLVKPNCPCYIDMIEAPDGKYVGKNKHNYYIAYGLLVKETKVIHFMEPDGTPIYVESKAGEKWCSIGDSVYVPGFDQPGPLPAKDLIYINGESTFFIVRDGKVINHSDAPFDFLD